MNPENGSYLLLQLIVRTPNTQIWGRNLPAVLILSVFALPIVDKNT